MSKFKVGDEVIYTIPDNMDLDMTLGNIYTVAEVIQGSERDIAVYDDEEYPQQFYSSQFKLSTERVIETNQLSAGEALDYWIKNPGTKMRDRNGCAWKVDHIAGLDLLHLVGSAPFTFPEQKIELTWSEIEEAIKVDLHCDDEDDSFYPDLRERLGFTEEG